MALEAAWKRKMAALFYQDVAPKEERRSLSQLAENNLVVLTKRSDFVTLLKFGRKYKPSQWLLFNYKKNKINQLRCGWTVPRYTGNAVLRNRLKRWARELFRESAKNEVFMDVNLVFLKQEKEFYKNLTYEEFKSTFNQGFAKAEKRLSTKDSK